MESTERNRVWHSGPPPYIGWWNASASKSPTFWRWWNGVQWSHVVTENCGEDTAARHANMPYTGQDTMEWNDYWPEGARTPRVDPGLASKPSASRFSSHIMELLLRVAAMSSEGPITIDGGSGKMSIKYDGMQFRSSDGRTLEVGFSINNKEVYTMAVALPNFAGGETLNFVGFAGSLELKLV